MAERVCSICRGYPLNGVPGSWEPPEWCPDHPDAEIVDRPDRSDLERALSEAVPRDPIWRIHRRLKKVEGGTHAQMEQAIWKSLGELTALLNQSEEGEGYG